MLEPVCSLPATKPMDVCFWHLHCDPLSSPVTDRGRPLPRCPRRCDYHPTCFYHASRKQNPAFHSFDLDAAARLRLPTSNAACLASALRGKILGNGIVAVINSVLRFLPLSKTRRRQWNTAIRRNWSWLRRKISYRAFEHAVHIAFESGMAWVFRKCRHLTPNTALLVILGAVLWLPISFGAATAMHAVLFAKVMSWPAWMQLLHPLATVIAKSKLLVLPVYPAAWPQAKKHPFIQFVFKSYKAIKSLYLVKKFGFRYRQAGIAGSAAIDSLERTAGLTSAMRWMRKAHVAKHFGVEKPTHELRSFFSRWSIKFSAEYYEAKERQAASH